jgi:hypothetical protein
MGIVENNSVSVKVSLQIKDLYVFKLIESYTNTTYQFFGAICVLSLITLPFTGWSMSFGNNTESSILLVLFWRLILPLIYLSAPLYAYFNLRKQFMNIRKLREESEYYISNFGVDLESSSSSSKWRWDEFIKSTETKWYFAMFITKNEALLIPKRCFMNDEQIDVLKRLLKTKIEKKK